MIKDLPKGVRYEEDYGIYWVPVSGRYKEIKKALDKDPRLTPVSSHQWRIRKNTFSPSDDKSQPQQDNLEEHHGLFHEESQAD